MKVKVKYIALYMWHLIYVAWFSRNNTLLYVCSGVLTSNIMATATYILHGLMFCKYENSWCMHGVGMSFGLRGSHGGQRNKICYDVAHY